MKTHEHIDLSIIIVNWNSEKYLEKCIRSILKSTSGISYEIIVVDNASGSSISKIEKRFPQVIFVQSKFNLGFPLANNLGYKYSCGRNILFLNPDTEVIENAIPTLCSQIDSIENAGAIGCRLLNEDGTLQTSCVQAFPTILNQIMGIEILRRLVPNLRLWGMRVLFSQNKKPVAVDVISGACLMVKRHVFELIGHFSSDYFMYADDVDLCYKIKQQGFENYYTDAAKVLHYGGMSTQKKANSFSAFAIFQQSRYIYFRKAKGDLYANIYKIFMTIVCVFRLAVLSVAQPLVTILHFDISYSFNKWRTILKWSVNRPSIDKFFMGFPISGHQD